MHYFVPIANSIEESKTEFCHWEKGSPLRQMKRAELVTPPRRAGSKGLFKLELWRDEGRGSRDQLRDRHNGTTQLEPKVAKLRMQTKETATKKMGRSYLLAPKNEKKENAKNKQTSTMQIQHKSSRKATVTAAGSHRTPLTTCIESK
ncbi:hypothetical protein AVEN_105521-1 [Araneus ventricosus]|uniref:Uncharacterized protein n=1 Tax=Araneus ventricosus TaxID=182803 RepID=A0A4Y2GJ49_ARAVE|nr:hypothetical protein AVEN_105521-1 [Araneus ventricosus]